MGFVSTNKRTICNICGKECKARGMGGHKRLAHGIVEKKTIQVKSNVSTQTPNVSTQVKSNASTQVKDIITQVTQVKSNASTQVKTGGDINVSTQVKRPVDYVKRGEFVIKKEITQAFPVQKIVITDATVRRERLKRNVAMPFKDILSYPKFNSVAEEKEYIEKEINRVALIMGKTVEQYLDDLEDSLKNAHPTIYNDMYHA